MVAVAHVADGAIDRIGKGGGVKRRGGDADLTMRVKGKEGDKE